MSDKVVFTDFDGTYIRGDSYFRSLFYFAGYKLFFKSCIKLLFIILEYYFNFITRNEAKRRSYELIYKGMSIEHIDKKLNDFYFQMHIFPKVKKKINHFKSLGCKIIVVTASLDVYMYFLVKKFGFDGCICTETEKEGNILTGRLKRKNCNYYEKAVRIKESKYYNPGAQIIAFGNSRGDEDMFKLAGEFYFVDKKGNIKKGKTPW